MKLSLGLLVTGTLVLGYFMANLNPFLGIWDEQYHALVAKNLADNFWIPKLYPETPIPFDETNWTSNGIWLHKQPLFLWQMAISIKLFGANVLAVRLPSIIMHAIIPLFLFRIGTITMNKSIGFYAGLFFAISYYPLELIAGHFHTDHNDAAFLFYLIASFWAWFEYQNSGNKYWLIAIGILSGCAVLNKWLLGLLVYIIWFLTKLISDSTSRWKPKSYLPMIYAGLITILVFLPWQLYIFNQFPIEAQHELTYNSRHFFEVIEGHGGDNWYHFDTALKLIYGEGTLIPILMIFGAFSMIFKIDQLKYKVFIITTILFIYLFYTIAATKMPAFTLIASPFILLGYATMIDSFISIRFEKIKSIWKKESLRFIVLLIPLLLIFKIDKIGSHHDLKDPENKYGYINMAKNALFIEYLNSLNLSDDYILFNAKVSYFGEISIIYFTGITSYQIFPEEDLLHELIDSGRKIAVVNLGEIPEYIKNNQDILLLEIPK